MAKRFLERFSTEPLLEWFYMHFERLGIVKIFTIWAGIIALFGLLYLLVSPAQGSLVYYSQQGGTVSSYVDSLYFSFVTATTTGYGDIVPIGLHRIIAFVEICIGFTIFVLMTSKIVGIKQERILREIYEISLQEKVSRIRSSLYLYRSDLSQLMGKVETNAVNKRDLAELWTLGNFIEQRIKEVEGLFGERKMTNIDVIDGKLLMKSINQSLAKTEDLFGVLDEHKVEWRREMTLFAFTEMLSVAKDVMTTLHKKFPEGKEMESFNGHRERLSGLLQNR